MRKIVLLLLCIGTIVPGVAGYKVKLIKAKKPEQFQVRQAVGDVTLAADLLIQGGEQKDFFYKELTPSNVIAVRLAVFNRSGGGVAFPLESVELKGADGKPLPPVDPLAVADSVLQGKAITKQVRGDEPIATVQPVVRDSRTDPSDPRYDPRLDPSDPRYDPNDPTVRGARSRNPTGWGTPGVDVVLNPGTGGGGDLSKYEKLLIEKDFGDKAHSGDPIDSGMTRDRFLYFTVPAAPTSTKGYTLKIPAGKGIPHEVVLAF
jgi:hypothetical protein